MCLCISRCFFVYLQYVYLRRKKTIRSKLGNGLFSIKEKKNQSNSLMDMNKTISYILNHVISVVFYPVIKKMHITLMKQVYRGIF